MEKIENKTITENSTEKKVTVRRYQRKFPEGSGKYDFQHAEKVDMHLAEPLLLLDGFVRDGDYGENLVMLVEDMDETRHTLTTGSQVLVKQFKEEEKEGFPVMITVISVESKSGRNYLTFSSPEEKI